MEHNNTKTAESVKTIPKIDESRPVRNEYGYPVNINIIGKPIDRKPNYWTLLDEWVLMSAEDAAKAQLKGHDVIWGLVKQDEFQQSLAEYKSNRHKNGKGKRSDSKGRRTIDDTHIHYTDMVLLDYDECPLSEVPQEVIDRAWLMCPSASQLTPTESGDVLKMHFVHRMPERIPVEMAQQYRELYCELISKGKKYDRACMDARREFYGMNPKFSEPDKFSKVTLENRISLEVHSRILLEVTEITSKGTARNSKNGKHPEIEQSPEEVAEAKKKRGRPKKEEDTRDISLRIDEHILEHMSLEGVVTYLFPDWEWQSKGESTHSYDQWETVFFLREGTSNPTAFAVQHSKESNRIICHYKGDEFNKSLYEVYARYKLLLKGDENAETADISKELKGGKFVRLIDEICEKIGIDKFKFGNKEKSAPPPKEVLLEVAENFGQDRIKFCNLNTKVFYFVYNVSSGLWDYNSSLSYFVSELADMLQDFNEYLLEMDDYAPLKEDDLTRMVAIIKQHHANKNWILKEIPSFRNEYIGLADCDYNTKTNQFEPYSAEHDLQFRFSFNRADYDPSTNIKERYMKAFMFATGQNQTSAEILWLYKCAEVLKLGKQAWKALVISGGSRTGKSSFCRSLNNIEKNKTCVAEVNQNDLKDDFSFSKITGLTTCLHFPELSINTKKEAEWLLQIVDSSGGVTVNEKFKPKVTLNRDFPIYMSIQDQMKIPSGNDGLKSRLLFVKITLRPKAGLPRNEEGAIYDMKTGKSWHEELNELYHKPETQRQLFLWILENENSENVCRRLQDLIGSDAMIEQQTEVLIQNSPLTEAFENVGVVVTGNTDDYILASDLKSKLKAYLKTEEDMRNVNTSYINKMLVDFLENKHPMEWENMKGAIGKGEMIDCFIWSRSENKSIRAIKGLKYVSSSVSEVERGLVESNLNF